MESKTKSMKIFEGLVFIVVLAFGCSSANAVTLPFEDDFENIAIGDNPDENGWKNLFSGVSAYVSDAVAHTGSRSFRRESYAGWSRTDYVPLSEVPDLFSYEVSVYPDPTPGHSGAMVGFVEAFGNQGPVYNRFTITCLVGSIGAVEFSQGGVDWERTDIGEFSVGDWVNVRADLNFKTLTADLWLDGELRVTGFPILPKEFDDGVYGHVVLNKWGATQYNWGGGGTGVVYIDDVRIYETPAEEPPKPADLIITNIGFLAGFPAQEGTPTTIRATLKNIGNERFTANSEVDEEGNPFNAFYEIQPWDRDITDEGVITGPLSPYLRPSTSVNDKKGSLLINDVEPGEEIEVVIEDIIFTAQMAFDRLKIWITPLENDNPTNNLWIVEDFVVSPNPGNWFGCLTSLSSILLSPLGSSSDVLWNLSISTITSSPGMIVDFINDYSVGVSFVENLNKAIECAETLDWGCSFHEYAKAAAKVISMLPPYLRLEVAASMIGSTVESAWSCGTALGWGIDTIEKIRQIIMELITEFAKIGIESVGMFTESPVNLLTTDNYGNTSGVTEEGIVEEIEYSKVFIVGDFQFIMFPKTEFQTKVTGTGIGNYGLNVFYPYQGSVLVVRFKELPIVPGMICTCEYDWQLINGGGEGVILHIDADGDGFFEQIVIADNDLTSDEFALQTETVVDFDPDTLNLKSKGKFATVYIELPVDFDASEIDVFSLELNELVPPLPKPVEIGDYDSDGINDLMVKFDREELIEVLEPGEQIIDLTGRLWDGRPIAGFDFIRVIH